MLEAVQSTTLHYNIGSFWVQVGPNGFAVSESNYSAGLRGVLVQQYDQYHLQTFKRRRAVHADAAPVRLINS